MEEKLNHKFLYVSVILLFLNFLYRLLDQSKMLLYFPLDYNNDGSSYMAQLFFMKVCGFHETCYYWYNGFVNFLHSPPGWYFFTLPLFNLLKSVNVATYFSMILIFVISFIIIYFLYDKIQLSKTERVALFIFFFGNAIAIGNFIKLIRVHELFAWMNFIIFFFLIYYYKSKQIDWKYWLVIPAYAFILLSYQSVGVLSSLLFLSLFLVKQNKEKFYVAISAFFSLLITAFWWVPFILRLHEGGIPDMPQAQWVWTFNNLHFFTNIFIFIIPLILFSLFYFYIKTSRNKRYDFLFILPILLLAISFFLRIHPFIPVFGNIFPDPYLIFFIFFIIFLFLKINWNISFIKIFIPYFLIFLILISLGFNIFRTPFFVEPTDPLNRDLEIAFENLNDNFIIISELGTKVHAKAIYSYVPTKYNASTALGWYPEVKPHEYVLTLSKFSEYLKNNNCDSFIKLLTDYNVTNIIGNNQDCELLRNCSLNFLVQSNSICLYTIG